MASIVRSEEDLETIFRVFRHRKIDLSWIAERDMTDAEKLKVDISWRIQYYSYESWMNLINEEWKITHDLPWVTRLFEMSGLKGSVQDFIVNH